jgi:hypothetical protein
MNSTNEAQKPELVLGPYVTAGKITDADAPERACFVVLWVWAWVRAPFSAQYRYFFTREEADAFAAKITSCAGERQ